MKADNLSFLKLEYLEELETPCHVINLDVLRENVARIEWFKKRSGCKVFLTLKGISYPFIFSELQGVIDGVSASSLHECTISRDSFTGTVQTYCPVYRENEFDRILDNSDIIVFNSVNQAKRYSEQAKRAGKSCALRVRIAPFLENRVDVDDIHAEERFGIPPDCLDADSLCGFDGILVHGMCEQYPDALERMIDEMERKLFGLLSDSPDVKWINIGGGQMIGAENYDSERAANAIRRLREKTGKEIRMEPCEGVFVDTGFFVSRVCDIVSGTPDIVILDASAICHIPDAAYRGWEREIIGEVEDGYAYKVCGATCFGGDIFGTYCFSVKLKEGDLLVMRDTATYTMVKSNRFSGLQLPKVYTFCERKGFERVLTE